MSDRYLWPKLSVWCGTCQFGKKSRCHADCTGFRQRDRKNRQRNRWWHVDHNCYGKHRTGVDFARHEYSHVRESHCAGQPAKAGTIRLQNHCTGCGNAGVPWRGSGKNAGTGNASGLDSTGNRLQKRLAGQKDTGHCGANTRSCRSGALPDKPFHR